MLFSGSRWFVLLLRAFLRYFGPCSDFSVSLRLSGLVPWGGVPRINVVVFTGNLLRDTVVRRSCIFMPQGAKVAPKMFQIGHFGPPKQYGEPGVLQILAPHPKIPWPFSSMRKL